MKQKSEYKALLKIICQSILKGTVRVKKDKKNKKDHFYAVLTYIKKQINYFLMQYIGCI